MQQSEYFQQGLWTWLLVSFLCVTAILVHLLHDFPTVYRDDVSFTIGKSSDFSVGKPNFVFLLADDLGEHVPENISSLTVSIQLPMT